MTHYAEKTLERFALDSPDIRDQREAIVAHLAECKGCKDLYTEIREFYGALSGPEALPEHLAKEGTSLKLSPQYGAHAAMIRNADRPAMMDWVRTNRRAVTSSGTVAVIAAVMLFFAIRFGTGAPIAHHVVFDNATHAALVADRSGNVLFSLPLPQTNDVENFRLVATMKSVLIEDIDGDRIPEVISSLPVERGNQIDTHLLRVFRSDGSLLWTLPVGGDMQFGDTEISNHFTVRGVQVIQDAEAGEKSLFVAAGHNHSPFVFYRVSFVGDVVGEYRMNGHVMSFLSYDADKDGRSEIYFAGVVDKEMLERDFYIGILDPFDIQGVTEASFTPAPGFGVPASHAEITIARIAPSPLSPFTDKIRTAMGGITFRPDGNLTVVQNEFLAASGDQAQWDYVFSKELIPLQVNATDATRRVFQMLHAESGSLHALSDDDTRSMLQQITYWDGAAWQSDVLPVAGAMEGLARTLFNPVSADLTGNALVLMNAAGRVVGRVELNAEEVEEYRLWKNVPSWLGRKVKFIDVDQDGLNEILFYRKGKEEGSTLYTLECRGGDGSEILWRLPCRWDIEFPGKADAVPPYYTAGDLFVEDLDNDGVEELIMNPGNLNMFPSLVLRIDPRTGGVRNSYLHIGHIQGIKFVDLDGDKKKEVLLGGVANSYKEAAFVVLHGDDFSGVSPHTPEYAPVGWAPGNERAYFRIPQTIVGDHFWRTTPNNGFSVVDIIEPSRQMQVWVTDFQASEQYGEEGLAAIAVVFSFDLDVEGIATGSLFDGIVQRLTRTGELTRRIDTAYWEEYLGSIKRWNGMTWYTENVKLGKNKLSSK